MSTRTPQSGQDVSRLILYHLEEQTRLLKVIKSNSTIVGVLLFIVLVPAAIVVLLMLLGVMGAAVAG